MVWWYIYCTRLLFCVIISGRALYLFVNVNFSMKRRKRLKNKKEKERGVWEKETAEQYKNSQICKKESERKKHLMEGLLYDTTGSPIK